MLAIDELKHINNRGSVDSAYRRLQGITTAINQVDRFVMYSSALLDIYDEDLDMAQIKISFLSGYDDFKIVLTEYGLPSCDTISKYINARREESLGHLNNALEIYASISFLDSLQRSLQIIVTSRDEAYKKAGILFGEGKYYEAAQAFKALGEYKDSAQQYEECIRLHNQNHKYSRATCTEPEICEECSAIGAPALGHDWKDATCTEPKTCRRCGMTEGEPLGHAWKDATCTEPGVCTRCNAAGTDPTGHDWIEASCTEPKTCKQCGVTEGEPLEHDWLPATYEAPETCSRCSLTRGEKLILPIQVGDIVTYGKYPQTSSGTDSTPIEWLVLEVQGEKALLISKYGLDAKPYNTSYTDVTWETCSLRTWLNKDFINKAFTSQEQAAILTTTVDNSKSQGYSNWSTNGGNNTQDKVFLLSYAEANKYFDVTYNNSSNTRSRVAPTAYAIKQGAYISSSYNTADGQAAGWWWLRSPGSYRCSAAYVSRGGSLHLSGVSSYDACVRPAFWINLSSAVLGV